MKHEVKLAGSLAALCTTITSVEQRIEAWANSASGKPTVRARISGKSVTGSLTVKVRGDKSLPGIVWALNESIKELGRNGAIVKSVDVTPEIAEWLRIP